MVYADDVKILGGSVHTIKRNREALVVAGKEIGPEENAEKSKYLGLSRDQNEVQNHNIKIDDKSFAIVEQFKYLGRTLTNPNSIQEAIKSRLKSGNACHHSVQNPLSSSLLSKNLNIKIYGNIILSVVLYWCDTWSLTLSEEYGLRVLENRVLRRIFGPKRDEVTVEWRRLHSEHFNYL